MTPDSKQQQELHRQPEYICDDDDLGCLHDYLVAAIDGNDISELPRLWNQQLGVIRSRPYSAPAVRLVCPDCEGRAFKRWTHRESEHHSCGGVTPCPTCKGRCWISLQEHEALVAQQAKQEERERVLKPFERYAKSMRELECVAIRGDLIDMVKSLRHSKGGEQQ